MELEQLEDPGWPHDLYVLTMYHVHVTRKMSNGYIRWFYTISHPHIIALEEEAHIPKPTEQEAFYEIVAEQEEDNEYLKLIVRSVCVRYHSYMSWTKVRWIAGMLNGRVCK